MIEKTRDTFNKLLFEEVIYLTSDEVYNQIQSNVYLKVLEGTGNHHFEVMSYIDLGLYILHPADFKISTILSRL